MDYGLVLTGCITLAGILRCVLRHRDPTLPSVLLSLWGVSFALVGAGARMSTFVFCAATLNMIVAGIALIIVTRKPTRLDARIVGGLSLAIMPAHWVMSVSGGTANWTVYALSCNIVFISQCLVAGGWLDGVGRRVAGLFLGLRPLRRFRNGGR
jgi:hypothetical protein